MKIAFLVLLIPNIIFSQDEIDWKLSLISSVSSYRSNLLFQNEKNLLDLKNVLEKWIELEPNEEVFNDFIFQTHYSYSIKKRPFKIIVNKAKERFPESPLAENLIESDLIALANNSELVELMTANVLSFEYPFKIEIKQKAIDEVEFYRFNNNETIAEVGAGKGTFSFLVAMLNIELKIYVNELDNDLINYIETKKISNNFLIDQEKTQIIKGNKKNINIPENVDKIIIRNSLHHFSKKKNMLKSIKKSLNEGGSIFVYESLKNENRLNSCKKKMYENEIKTLMRDNGFSLVQEKRIDRIIILEYKIGK